jgi:subtilisin-like proprotein convertase family protein
LVGAAVRFDVTHTFVSDLTLVLTSPRGTVLVLADNNGGGGEDYTNTILVDSGPGTIGTVGYNTPPFTGTYRPEMLFSSYTGQAASGLFVVELFDFYVGDGGSFNAFSLAICLAP